MPAPHACARRIPSDAPGNDQARAIRAALRDKNDTGRPSTLACAQTQRPAAGTRRPSIFGATTKALIYRGFRFVRGPPGPGDDKGKTRGPGDAHHQQQELRLLVLARLVAVQNGRPRVRGSDALERRPRHPGRALAALALVPGALPDP